MNDIIKLSIIVPVYNVEQYLRECVDSIINAYKEGIEVILIDDGTKDNSDKICDEYSSKYDYIKVIHRENGGLSAARNTGINSAQGEYIWFVDSDDYIESNSIEVLFDVMKKDKDMIFMNYKQFNSNGEIDIYQDFNEDDDLTVEPYNYLRSLGNISYAAQKFIIKRKVIFDNNLFFTEGIYHEDEDWTPRAVCVAKNFTTLMIPLYNYRVGNPNSITGMLNPKKVMDKLIVSKNLYKLVSENDFSEGINSFLKTRIAHNYITALNESDRYDKEVRKKLLLELKANKYLLDGIKDKKAMMVRAAINSIGISNTSGLLNLRARIRKDS